MFSTENAGSFGLTHLLRMSKAMIHLGKGGLGAVAGRMPISKNPGEMQSF